MRPWSHYFRVGFRLVGPSPRQPTRGGEATSTQQRPSCSASPLQIFLFFFLFFFFFLALGVDWSACRHSASRTSWPYKDPLGMRMPSLSCASLCHSIRLGRTRQLGSEAVRYALCTDHSRLTYGGPSPVSSVFILCGPEETDAVVDGVGSVAVDLLGR
ncbi:hypothetical protein VTK73DRAFT_10169 [Phialemonium thermophilum]|uniref:Secreted protein n=1 Tax=Phialemonium thermophilum TaxID=223376 RepID=A0ABR3VY57_9PEZI